MDPNQYKAHLKSLEKFNEWSEKQSVLPETAGSLSMLNNLYELIPRDRRLRIVDISGIVKMREALSSIKRIVS